MAMHEMSTPPLPPTLCPLPPPPVLLCPKVNPVLNGAPASITPNEFLEGLNADNKNEWVTVVMLSHVYALKVCSLLFLYLCKIDPTLNFR